MKPDRFEGKRNELRKGVHLDSPGGCSIQHEKGERMKPEEIEKLLDKNPGSDLWVYSESSETWASVDRDIAETIEEVGDTFAIIGPPNRDKFVEHIDNLLTDFLYYSIASEDSELREDWVYSEVCGLKTEDAMAFVSKLADEIGDARQFLCAPFELKLEDAPQLQKIWWGGENETKTL